jgi:predicted 3-demethylubiquinone-9 3-methyltransferase (glyoxalase superfamily)
MVARNTIWLWFNGTALEAAQCYAKTVDAMTTMRKIDIATIAAARKG